MSDLIDAVIKTREISKEIAAQSLKSLVGASEVDIHKLILSGMSTHDSIFPKGWYAPPPGGASVLFDQNPFERLKYDSLRNPTYWPQKNSVFNKETVASIYFSPVDRVTGMMGDIGFTIYTGDNEEIKKHLNSVYESILEVAKYIEIGMKISDICEFAKNLFKDKFRRTRWVTISSDPGQSINLGHSVAGSSEGKFIVRNNFDELVETLKNKRIHLIDTETSLIPETCAFIVESRLEDINKPYLPSAYFQFIVCFDKGRKTILRNIDDIIKLVGMNYINTN